MKGRLLKSQIVFNFLRDKWRTKSSPANLEKDQLLYWFHWCSMLNLSSMICHIVGGRSVHAKSKSRTDSGRQTHLHQRCKWKFVMFAIYRCLLSTETPAMEDPLIHIVSLEPGHARDVYKPYWLIYLNNSHIPGDVKETSKAAGDFLLPGFFKAVLKNSIKQRYEESRKTRKTCYCLKSNQQLSTFLPLSTLISTTKWSMVFPTFSQHFSLVMEVLAPCGCFRRTKPLRRLSNFTVAKSVGGFPLWSMGDFYMI